MKLYFSQNSPYARRTRMVLHEAGLGDQIEEIDLTPRADNDAVLFANGPGGKVPALITDEGAFLVESLIICRYLDDIAGGVLTPTGAVARDQALQVEGIASVLMDTLYFRTNEGRREEAQQSSVIVEKDHKIALSAYDALDSFAGDLSNNIHLGTIATVAALGYADWRHPTDDWRTGRPALAEWFEKISNRPAMQISAPIY